MAQVGDILRILKEESATPPRVVADLLKLEKAFPLACGKLKAGEIVMIYGQTIQDGASDRIIAYEGRTPESGGLVLMQDGLTIKQMTAEMFRGSAKAGEVAK